MRGRRILLVQSDTRICTEVEAVLNFAGCDVSLYPLREKCQERELPLGIEAVFACPEARDEQQVRAILELFRHLPLVLVKPEDRAESLPTYWESLSPSLLIWPTTQQSLSECLKRVGQSRTGIISPRLPELFRSLTGSSLAVRHTRKLIEQVAASEATVLILGESGTGKEVVARNLHHFSARHDKSFVAVNCGAIPPELLESELFGHEKGAFTGAFSSRQGRFELAEGGTLFLDEIGDMPLSMQVKLLRVLQERTFERVGSNKTFQCDVRIVAATHRNLEDEIRRNRFREDLYYRLNVFPIEVPPLRQRLEDIPLLVDDLIARLRAENREYPHFTPAAFQALQRYPWPGNIRELANLVERLAILYPSHNVDEADLPEPMRRRTTAADDLVPEQGSCSFSGVEAPRLLLTALPEEGLDLREHLSNLEYDLIRQALNRSNGVVAHAAIQLRMRRTTLVEKLRKYGLRGDEAGIG